MSDIRDRWNFEVVNLCQKRVKRQRVFQKDTRIRFLTTSHRSKEAAKIAVRFLSLEPEPSRKTAMRFEGRTIIVTGASRGIGKAVALQLASEGANIGLNYRSHTEEAEAV